MSDLSDELHEAIHATVVSHREKGEVVNAADPSTDNRLEGVEAVKETCDYHTHQITQDVRRVYRRFAGGKKFESPRDARERTEPLLLPLSTSCALNAYADGIQMGRKDSFVYKKYKTLKKLDELVVAPGFREASDVTVARYQSDPDCVEVVQHYISATLHGIGLSTGYATDKPLHKVEKIWDLWVITMRSVVIGLYVTGYHLGEKQKADEERARTDDIFHSIISGVGVEGE